MHWIRPSGLKTWLFLAGRLHPLCGDLAGHWSVVVNGHWRLTFRFEGRDAIVVDYQDYH
ncbi:type II toxin-antitoxin system RelE/ParE family toxin [Cupriavidus sp. a3]|uniref:type II toxin-antitoxin system RelE/ParE family toxin n=1 Tax=Cupriavidus sp. a3 TaxID=3242158 RepID=UPI003D9C56DB